MTWRLGMGFNLGRPWGSNREGKPGPLGDPLQLLGEPRSSCPAVLWETDPLLPAPINQSRARDSAASGADGWRWEG